MIFEKKKIQIETLGEYLREVRGNLQLSLEEVAKKTNIKPAFLKGLEQGDFSVLPPNVYVLGFLKQLAKFYNIEAGALVDQYKKERNIQQQVENNHNRPKTWLGTKLGKLVITPKYMSVSLGLMFVVITIVYIIWQVLSINKTPNLEIFEPQNNQVVLGTFVEISGQTDPGMHVTINGQDIFVDNQGKFKNQLGISAGPKDLQITAKNKFDKAITKTISIVGQDKPTPTVVPKDAPLKLKLEFSADVNIMFSADDSTAQTGSFHTGEVKLLTAQQKIILSTSNAGATKATLNGQVIGALGKANEKLDNIPFYSSSN